MTIDIVIMISGFVLFTTLASSRFIKLILTLLVSFNFICFFPEVSLANSQNDDYLLGSHKSLEVKDDDAEIEAPSVLLSISPAKAESSKEDNSNLEKQKNGFDFGSSSRAKNDDSSKTDLIAQKMKGPIDPAMAKYGLSDDTYDLARSWGLLESIESLKKTPRHFSSEQMDGVVRRLIIRQQIDDMVLTKMFDVRKTLNIIDKQIDNGQAVRAQLSTRRDKAIRFNTYADIFAGGITGIIAGSLRLGSLLFIAPDVVDVVEGVGEAGLAGIALRTENIQHSLERGVPNLLGKIIYPDHKHRNNFPDSVWKYLNSVPSHSKTNMTRREELVEKWTTNKFCLIHKGHRLHPHIRAKHASGTHKGRAKLSIELLEDRIAMLRDLRVSVTKMEDNIAEIYAETRKY